MTVSPEEILISDESSREGNGILTQEISDAIRLTAIKEGILLDPVYTGKAMAGLIDLTRKGYFKNDDGMVFLHTGGTPALFVYKEELLELMKKR
jgi:1-aminocyclopropane-1-carboxylate deaminase/D-cysteine desulfhydrase-like pyridoxal-dependent ACC family enzyme